MDVYDCDKRDNEVLSHLTIADVQAIEQVNNRIETFNQVNQFIYESITNVFSPALNNRGHQ